MSILTAIMWGDKGMAVALHKGIKLRVSNHGLLLFGWLTEGCFLPHFEVTYINCEIAPVAQLDRAPASGAGRERSSRSRGVFV